MRGAGERTSGCHTTAEWTRAHRSSCGWFWTWTGVGFGLALGFAGIFGVGPFLLPFVTLLLGIAARRRAAPRAVGMGVLVAVVGTAAAVDVTPEAFLVTPLATLAVGLAPEHPPTVAGLARTVLIEAGGTIAGAALAGAALGEPPTLLLAAVAGVAALPLLRSSSGAPLRG